MSDPIVDTEILNLHHRMDLQDAMLLEIRDRITTHIATEESFAPAIHELVSLWRASKVLGSFATVAAGMIAAIWAFMEWAKSHVRL